MAGHRKRRSARDAKYAGNPTYPGGRFPDQGVPGRCRGCGESVHWYDGKWRERGSTTIHRCDPA